MELEKLRTEIDEIDRRLVALFLERMDVSARVAAYKKEKGLPVFDPARERALLERIEELAGKELGEDALALYATILDRSRAYQRRCLGEGDRV